MLIRTEQTPNPATRKFLPGQTVIDAGTRDFADPESAQASPLASALFDSGMVEGVFYGRDFISVTAAPGVSWNDLEPLVVEILLDHFVSGAPLFAPGTAAGIHVVSEADFEENPEDADIIEQIKELIETRVRPAVAQDGGTANGWCRCSPKCSTVAAQHASSSESAREASPGSASASPRRTASRSAGVRSSPACRRSRFLPRGRKRTAKSPRRLSAATASCSFSNSIVRATRRARSPISRPPLLQPRPRLR